MTQSPKWEYVPPTRLEYIEWLERIVKQMKEGCSSGFCFIAGKNTGMAVGTCSCQPRAIGKAIERLGREIATNNQWKENER